MKPIQNFINPIVARGGTQVGRQEVTKVPKIECKDQLGTPRGESDVQIAHYFLQSAIAHYHSAVVSFHYHV